VTMQRRDQHIGVKDDAPGHSESGRRGGTR
jgi:hypothetical protein